MSTFKLSCFRGSLHLQNYIKNFGIYNFTENESDYIIAEDNPSNLDEFIEPKYGIEFNNQGWWSQFENTSTKFRYEPVKIR